MIKNILYFLLVIVVLWFAVSFVRIRILAGRSGVLIRSAVPYERAVTGKQKILVLGDSLAYGTGTTASEKSVAGLVAAHYPTATVVNKSVNGKRTGELAREVQQLDGSKYDLILIIIGGNDILRPWVDLKQSGKNLDIIYSAASQHSDKVIALTTGNFRYTTFFLWPANLYFETRSTDLRNKAKAAAGNYTNVTYVDMVERNRLVPFDHLKEAPDHLHLSDDGAQYWYQAILASRALK